MGSTGFWSKPCFNSSGNAIIYGLKVLFWHLSSLVPRISNRHNIHWTELVHTILHSEFHSWGTLIYNTTVTRTLGQKHCDSHVTSFMDIIYITCTRIGNGSGYFVLANLDNQTVLDLFAMCKLIILNWKNHNRKLESVCSRHKMLENHTCFKQNGQSKSWFSNFKVILNSTSTTAPMQCTRACTFTKPSALHLCTKNTQRKVYFTSSNDDQILVDYSVSYGVFYPASSSHNTVISWK